MSIDGFCQRRCAKRSILLVGMKRIGTWLAFAISLLPTAAFADLQLAKGEFLVATEVVQGDVFFETVILILHYDENGAMGIVVNRPTDVLPEEVVADVEAFSAYDGALFWGGPVEMYNLRALMRTDTPPEGATTIMESVHHVHIDDELLGAPADPATLRFFIGYSGWSAGQLDREMARGSWRIVPASVDDVFAEDPRALWERLSPKREYRAAVAEN